MISEARARFANTQGWKAKQKAREVRRVGSSAAKLYIKTGWYHVGFTFLTVHKYLMREIVHAIKPRKRHGCS